MTCWSDRPWYIHPNNILWKWWMFQRILPVESLETPNSESYIICLLLSSIQSFHGGPEFCLIFRNMPSLLRGGATWRVSEIIHINIIIMLMKTFLIYFLTCSLIPFSFIYSLFIHLASLPLNCIYLSSFILFHLFYVLTFPVSWPHFFSHKISLLRRTLFNLQFPLSSSSSYHFLGSLFLF
jgi:hypothetical protein